MSRLSFPLAALFPALLLSACTDQPAAPPVAPPGPGSASLALECTASVRQAALSCGRGARGGPNASIVGGQGLNVEVVSSEARYDSAAQVFRAEVLVRNLMPDRILGSYDGQTAAGLRVFFHNGPTATAGMGSVSVRNPDGYGTFTTADQPYFAYGDRLRPGEGTFAHTWEFDAPRGVETFAFTLYVEAPLSPLEASPPVYGSFTQMSASHSHTCGLDEDGRGFCWGYGGLGRLGTGVTRSFFDPAPITGGHAFHVVSAGGDHSCGLDTGGKAWCWGDNARAQVGAPPEVVRGGFTPARFNPHPAEVQGGFTFATLDAGGAHSCALDAEGRAYCWGANGAGQLGRGFTSDSTSVPAPVAGSLRFVLLRAGSGHTCGLEDDGELWCWGSNSAGQLGHYCGPERCGTSGQPAVTHSPVPLKVGTALTFATFDAGSLHTCGVTPAGKAWCWGNAADNILAADPGTYSTGTPQPTYHEQTFAQIELGSQEVCAIRADGALFCWGKDEAPGADPYLRIRQEPGLWKLVTVDHNHRCAAAASDGAGYCWGREQYGEMGNAGHHENTASDPVALAPLHVVDLPPKAGWSITGAYNRAYSFNSGWGDLDRDFPSYSNDDYGVVRYEWSFGDGATGVGQYVNHTYEVDGLYWVTLTVTDTKGQRGMQTIGINVDGYPD
jgi:alpha-tubulin suppressor-like RCC1 family protein